MLRRNRVLIRSVLPHFILWVTNLSSDLVIIVSIRVYNIPLLVLNLLLAVADRATRRACSQANSAQVQAQSQLSHNIVLTIQPSIMGTLPQGDSLKGQYKG